MKVNRRSAQACFHMAHRCAAQSTSSALPEKPRGKKATVSAPTRNRSGNVTFVSALPCSVSCDFLRCFQGYTPPCAGTLALDCCAELSATCAKFSSSSVQPRTFTSLTMKLCARYCVAGISYTYGARGKNSDECKVLQQKTTLWHAGKWNVVLNMRQCQATL